MPDDIKIASLAMNGGVKAVSAPLEPRRHFMTEERDAAVKVMNDAIAVGGAPGYGDVEEFFCREFAEMLGGGYADAVNSGSTAVFVALRALDLEPYTEIIVPPVTDPGGMMPVVMMNCIPIIADSEPGSFNMSLESVKQRYNANTSAILVPHIAGEPADIENIVKFADEKGIPVVEDVAQAHGASINGHMLGSLGRDCGYSMMYGKHTCVGGQGGVVFTKSEELYWKIRRNSDRGKPFNYSGTGSEVASLNFNLDDIHCAIGRVQLKKTFAIGAGRRRVCDALRNALSDIPCLYWNKLPDGAVPTYWFFRTLFKEGFTSVNKREFCAALSAEGVPVNSWYQATPYMDDWYTTRHAFAHSGYPWVCRDYKGDHDKVYTLDDLPNAAASLKDTIITFALESWTDENIAQVSDAYHKVYEAYKLN